MRRTLSISLLAAMAVSAHAQLTLPFAGTDPGATISSFQITKSGTAGRANTLYITNASNASEALFASTAGLGKAGLFTINNASNANQAIRGESNGTGVGIFGYMTGTGRAGSFRIINAANTSAALTAQTDGSGPAFLALSGSGLAASFQGGVQMTGSVFGTMLDVRNADTIGNSSAIYGQAASATGSGVYGLADAPNGNSRGGYFESRSATGIGALGYVTTLSGAATGVLGESQSPAGFGVVAVNNFGVALKTLGLSQLNGNVELTGSSKLMIGGSGPVFPLDFSESSGDKVSLWGTSPTSHYGLGVQSGVLQIFCDQLNSDVAIGYGGSGNMTERVRFTGNAEMKFRPSDFDSSSTISTPYDLFLSHDRDNDNIDSWLRVFVDNGTLEQMRIDDGDEATTRFDGAVTANGIDFAEAFKVTDDSLEPGDLVVNHGTDWEYISRSRGAYDQGVIGVISTKPAFVAGMSFNAEDKMDLDLTRRRDEARRKKDEKLEKKLTMQMSELVKKAYRPVAFMGRVPVKVMGVVRMGDHLTASNLPGVAMTMNKPGQSVGIALESSQGGFSKIMVMIQPGFYTPMAANQGGDKSAPDGKLQAKLDRVLAENEGLRKEVADLRAQVLVIPDLRSRLEHIEQALKNR